MQEQEQKTFLPPVKKHLQDEKMRNKDERKEKIIVT